MTFNNYIIKTRGFYFYHLSLIDMEKVNSKLTIEEWFGDLYLEYRILYRNN